jgi:hypothetical protein
MRSRNYYRLRLAVRVGFWLALAGLVYLVSGFLWWTGSGYCPGSMSSCVGL